MSALRSYKLTAFDVALLGFLISLVCFYLLQQHLRLAFWGTTTHAQVIDRWDLKHKPGRQCVDYRFNDSNGNAHRGQFTVWENWVAPSDGRFEVVYLQSDPSIFKVASDSFYLELTGAIMGLVFLGCGLWHCWQKRYSPNGWLEANNE